MSEKRRTFLILALGAMTLTVFLWVGMTPVEKSGAPKYGVVKERNFLVTVQSIGELDALRSTLIHSGLQGSEAKIVWIIDDGDFVEKGDIVVRFDPTEFEKSVDALKDTVSELTARVEANAQLLAWERHQVGEEIKAKEFELKTAQIDLRKLEKGEGPMELEQLEETLEEARSEYEQFRGFLEELKEYREEKIVEESDFRQAQKKLKELEKKYRSANSKFENYSLYLLPSNLEKARATVAKASIALEQAKKGGGFRIGKAIAEYKLAEQELRNKKNRLEKALEELEKTVLPAPSPGIAILYEGFYSGEKRKPRIGDKIVGMQPLVYLPDISRMVVRSRVREIDLYKIAIGKPVVVRVDAYPKLHLRGKVSSIGALATTLPHQRSREKYFTLTVLLEQEEKRLRPGMTAHLEIRCQELKTLAVPIQSVFHEGQNPFCYVIKPGGFEKRRVQLGHANEEWVQISGGLQANERVALVAPEWQQ